MILMLHKCASGGNFNTTYLLISYDEISKPPVGLNTALTPKIW